jgi:hypothetical protein
MQRTNHWNCRGRSGAFCGCEVQRQVTHNNRMQRGVTHKVPRRGRDRLARKTVMRARVREALCTRADAERWASVIRT